MSTFFIGLAVFAATILILFSISLLSGYGNDKRSCDIVGAFVFFLSLLGVGLFGTINPTMGCVWLCVISTFKHFNIDTVSRSIVIYIDAFIIALIITFFFLGGS